MKRMVPFLLAAALAAAGCSSPPPGRDTSLEAFTALSAGAGSVLAEEIREPETAVAAFVDVDMRSDPRRTLLRYAPVRFRTGTGDLRLHALAPTAVFPSMAGLRDEIRRRYEKGTMGVVVFFNGVAAGTRDLDDAESRALSEILAGRLQPMLDEAKIPFAWIVPGSARLFPAVK